MSELELEQEPVEEETTRDVLEAAFEASEAQETETETIPDEPVAEVATPEGEPLAPVEVADESAEAKAPNSWSPASRETWADIPKAAQAEIAKREQQTAQALQSSAQARNFTNTFGDMAQRYTGFISANSGNPLQEVEGLLQTASIMQSGTQAQKAQMAADLIKNYGVDIQTLDDVLVGQAPKSQVPDEVQQRLNQLEGYFNQQQQQQVHRNQQVQQNINQEVSQFCAANEFANDLRPVMADFMDIAERQGGKISLQDAYTRAVATRPDIQQILQSRQIGQTNQQQVAASRRAAVSVPQTGGIGGPPPAPGTMRDAILDAWDNT